MDTPAYIKESLQAVQVWALLYYAVQLAEVAVATWLLFDAAAHPNYTFYVQIPFAFVLVVLAGCFAYAVSARSNAEQTEGERAKLLRDADPPTSAIQAYMQSHACLRKFRVYLSYFVTALIFTLLTLLLRSVYGIKQLSEGAGVIIQPSSANGMFQAMIALNLMTIIAFAICTIKLINAYIASDSVAA